MRLCGIDEAGRGPVIGPMVIVGVLISYEKEELLREINVRDSKLLSQKERIKLYEKIIDIVDSYETRIIMPDEIDYAVWHSTLNLNWLEAIKSAEIINHLMPDRAIIDAPSPNTSAYKNYLKKKLSKKDIEIIAEHKADSNYVVVSAASIIAKVIRDMEVEKLRKIYGDFGSGYLSDEKTVRFLQENHTLPIFRKSWQPWKDIEERKKQKSLSEFCNKR
ncbi:MAG: ribonuclease HII [Candidatus Woesearchaeota archaeon]